MTTPQPSLKTPTRARKILVGVVVLALAVLVAAILIPGDNPASAVPAYRIVERVTKGGQEIITVHVDAHPGADGLRAVFDRVKADTHDAGGHLVQINCATGGTDKADNRLANGRFGIGADGVAETGLAEGTDDWVTVAGATCP